MKWSMLHPFFNATIKHFCLQIKGLYSDNNEKPKVGVAYYMRRYFEYLLNLIS
jgi:hypothetical protein